MSDGRGLTFPKMMSKSKIGRRGAVLDRDENQLWQSKKVAFLRPNLKSHSMAVGKFFSIMSQYQFHIVPGVNWGHFGSASMGAPSESCQSENDHIDPYIRFDFSM